MIDYEINPLIYRYIDNYVDYLHDVLQLDIYHALMKRDLFYKYLVFVIHNPLDGRESTRWGYNLGNGRGRLYQRFDDGDSGSQWFIFYSINRKKKIFIRYLLHNNQVHKAFHPNKYAQKKSLSEIADFHSWMKRLDEVKGARPTYWCQ